MDRVFHYPSLGHKILRPIIVGGRFGPETAALILYWVIGLAPMGRKNRLIRRGCSTFVGRKKELLELHESLQHSPIVAIAGSPNVTGLGKTELALQYVEKYGSLYPGGIFWIEGLATLQEFQPPPESLLVLEDVAEIGSLEPYLAAGHTVRVLVTVRAGRATTDLLATIPHVVEIGILSPSETLELWSQYLPSSRLSTPEARELAGLIGEWMGYLPLGLDLAVHYLLNRPELSFEVFLQQIQPRWLNQGTESGAIVTGNAERGVRAILDLSYEDLSIEAQMLGSLLSLLAPTPIPWALVEQMIFPLIQSIWLDVMQMDFCQGKWTGAEQDWQLFLEQMQAIWVPAREELGRSHLLTELEEDQIQVHPLVQGFFQEQLHHQPDAPIYPQAVIQTFLSLTQGGMGTSQAVLVPHLIEISHTLTEFLSPVDQVGLWLKLAEFYEGQAALDLSSLWQTKAMSRLDQMRSGQQSELAMTFSPQFVGESSIATLYPEPAAWMAAGGALQDLAYVPHPAVQYHPEPLPDYVPTDYVPTDYVPINYADDVLPLRADPRLEHPSNYASTPIPTPSSEQRPVPPESLPPDYVLQPGLLVQLDGLAVQAAHHCAEGRYSAAEPLYRQMVELSRQQGGQGHPQVAVGLSYLAKIYVAQKRYDEAEDLYLEALELRYNAYGENHSDVAASLNDLGYLYEMQNLWEEAEPLYVKSLELRQRLLEDFHPDVVMSLTNLAHLYEAQHRYQSAESLYRQVLRLLKRRSGSQHPDVATGLNNLAYLYESQRRYDKAAMLYQQALDLRWRLLGPDHPDVATSLNNLAAVSTAQGKYRKAEQLYLQAVEISDRVLGADHANTVIFRENLQIFRREQRSRQAKPASVLSRIFSR